MRYLFLFYFSFINLFSSAQVDSIRKIEPDQETSFEKYELLIIAILGLLILMGLRIWFKRARKI